ncbi:MAG TPA: glycoside hydrolase family 3 protein [Cytophagaceae bacterium]
MKARFLLLILLIFGACKAKAPISQVVEDKSQEDSQEVKVVEPVKKFAIDPSRYSLDVKIGQMIMVGINDRKSVSESDVLLKEIKEGKMGGIILFEKNIHKDNSKETLKSLIADMQKNAAIPLFISIDEEGGRVHRLKEKYGFVGMPSAAHLGKLNNIDSTYYYTRNLARLLSELGINLNYAPVLDLGINKDNPVIYKLQRSYSGDPEVVARHAKASIKAHHEEGVKTVVKHFPGHGSSMEDSHLGLTDVTNRWNIIELFPYNELIRSGEVDAVMSAHIVNCRLDTTCLPATLSNTVITGVLRNMMNYDGVVFSDDMQMYAISKNYGLENAIELAINAGIDVIMFGNNVNLKDRITATEIHAIIKKKVESGAISKERIDESFKRIMEFKKKKVK